MAGKDQRETDLNRLDEAIEAVLYVLRLEFPVPMGMLKADEEEELRARAILLGKNRCESAKALVLLLERRSKLLGLDAQPNQSQIDAPETPLERMRRQLTVVEPRSAGNDS